MLEQFGTYQLMQRVGRDAGRWLLPPDQRDVVELVPKGTWAWAVEHWATGGLRQSIEDVAANLPPVVVDRLKEKHGYA